MTFEGKQDVGDKSAAHVFGGRMLDLPKWWRAFFPKTVLEDRHHAITLELRNLLPMDRMTDADERRKAMKRSTSCKPPFP